MAAGETHELRTTDGRVVAYCEWGDPAGGPVVFHHGTPSSRLERHPDDAILSELGIRLLTLDRPGYGGSDARPGRKVVDVADDVRALADELGLARFGVCGASGGGPHALATAARLSGRVTRAAVLVGAAPADDPELDFTAGMTELNVREFGAAMESPEALAALLEPSAAAMQADPAKLVEELLAELPPPDVAVVSRPAVRPMLEEAFRAAARQGARGWIDDDLAFTAPWGFSLADVEVDVRLWQGELDVLVPRSHGEYLTRKLPRATFDLVPDAGHFLYDHWPAAFRWVAGG